MDSNQTDSPLRVVRVPKEDISSIYEQSIIVDYDNVTSTNNYEATNMTTESNNLINGKIEKWIQPMVCPQKSINVNNICGKFYKNSWYIIRGYDKLESWKIFYPLTWLGGVFIPASNTYLKMVPLMTRDIVKLF